jgi:hypothetical protein
MIPYTPGSSIAYAATNFADSRVDFFSVNATGWECNGLSAPHVTYSNPIAVVPNQNGWVIVHDFNTTGSSDTHTYFSQVYDDGTTSTGAFQSRSRDRLGRRLSRLRREHW